jgi:hypothetical protein
MKLLSSAGNTNAAAPGHDPIVTVSAENLALMMEEAEHLSLIKLVNVPLADRINWLEEVLGKHPTLSELELVKCDLSQLTSAETPASSRFLRALALAPALKKINLNGVIFEPDIPLEEAIPGLVRTQPSEQQQKEAGDTEEKGNANPDASQPATNQLETLSLKNCPYIDHCVITALLECLQTNQKLKTLYLDPDENMGLSNTCVKAIGDMLVTNQSLEEISVRIPSGQHVDLLPVLQALETNHCL